MSDGTSVQFVGPTQDEWRENISHVLGGIEITGYSLHAEIREEDPTEDGWRQYSPTHFRTITIRGIAEGE